MAIFNSYLYVYQAGYFLCDEFQQAFLMTPGFVWKCRVNIPNEIAIFHRDKDQQNHWV